MGMDDKSLRKVGQIRGSVAKKDLGTSPYPPWCLSVEEGFISYKNTYNILLLLSPKWLHTFPSASPIFLLEIWYKYIYCPTGWVYMIFSSCPPQFFFCAVSQSFSYAKGKPSRQQQHRNVQQASYTTISEAKYWAGKLFTKIYLSR